MNIVRGRARRPDDWPSSHVRARADLSDRLDFSLEPDEAAWLDSHLVACPDCRSIAAAYAAQRLELRALLGRNPAPPRDLWARTAAAIEAESRFRDGRARSSDRTGRRLLAPSALLATALVVAVTAGVLTSSQHPGGDGGAGSPIAVAGATTPAPITADASIPGPTRIPVTQKFAVVAKDASGLYTIKTTYVDTVCPSSSASPCLDTNPTTNRAINLDQTASTVFGSPDDARLIVMPNSGTISVVPLGSEPPVATPTATVTASPSPVVAASASSTMASAGPTAPSAAPSSGPPTPRPTPTASAGQPTSPPTASPVIASPAVSPTPSIAVTPSPDGSIAIAHDVILVGQSAAYSASGDWFAFTARPVDGSTGPDVYAWRVGDAIANRMTSDHRSVFGSWLGDTIVASAAANTTTDGASDPPVLTPVAFTIDPATTASTLLSEVGRAWRPTVDPNGRRAVYWAGSVRSIDGVTFAPEAGRLVLGDWAAAPGHSGGAASSTVPATPYADQGAARRETTIAAGRIDEWDARWDATGTHLAIWIADASDATTGRLSLYTVDSFDGKVDLKSPLLKDAPAVAGFALANGQLVWAEPPGAGGTSGRVQLLAWTDDGVGTVSTVTGPAIVIR